jgi:hypothetical protein
MIRNILHNFSGPPDKIPHEIQIFHLGNERSSESHAHLCEIENLPSKKIALFLAFAHPV